VEESDAVRSSAEALYAGGSEIWDASDLWNDYKKREISRFCRAALAAEPQSSAILNAGSGSHLHDWLPAQAVNLDRFAAQANQLPNPVVGELESLPFSDAMFDTIVCVGSTLNYASAIEAISELARVLKPGGRLILHFESSDSAEHLGTGRWRRPVASLATINSGRDDHIWIYSRAFIRRTLSAFGITVERERRFHIGSAFLLWLGLPQAQAARGARLDPILRPVLGRLGDDVILIGRRS
jgi:SAM-dependent methyltransferase